MVHGRTNIIICNDVPFDVNYLIRRKYEKWIIAIAIVLATDGGSIIIVKSTL